MSDREALVNNSTAPPPYSGEAPKNQEKPPPYTPNPNPAGASVPPPYPPQTGSPGNFQYQSFDNVVSHQPDVITVIRLGPAPVFVQCPSCGHFGMTCISYTPGALTFLTAVICFFFCIICTFLPFCIGELQDVSHHCSSCGYHIGTYARM